jgi:protocatechuate 3,4-dioxygenase beta subunit
MMAPLVRFTVATCAGFLLLTSNVAVQQVRDPAARDATVGAGRLTGTVVTDETPQRPLRRATVTLIEAGGAIVSRLATTDELGRYTFSGLPAGKYNITASRPPYLRGSYGAHRMISPASTIVGTTIPLAAGQQVSGLTILMQPGAAISGTVRDGEGQPAANASINVWYYQWISGIRKLVSAGASTNTDDRGMYRIYGLAPGEYMIAVVPIGPRQPELLVVTDAEVRRAMDLIQRPPGSAASSPPQSTTAAQSVGWAPVFYPGTTEFSQATPIRVAVGEDRGGVDVQTRLVSTSRVEGTVIGLDGAPAPGQPVQLVSANIATAPEIAGFLSADTTTDRQGRFVLNSIAPGSYSVQARTTNQATILFGVADVMLQGQSVSVTLQLAPLPAVTGRVVFEGTSPLPEMSTIRIAMSRLVSAPPYLGSSVIPQANGDFTLPAVVPDRYRVSATETVAAGTAAWILKSVIVGGQDMADRPIDFRSAAASSVVVTMTDRTTELSGRLIDGSNAPAADYYVIVFSQDPEAWTPTSRRIQIARPEHDGRFMFRNLPAGDYRIVAVTDVQQGEWLNPDFLAQLIDASIKVVVPDGGKVVQDMRIK